MKTPEELIALYYQSVGRGATLLLNVPPNRDGLLAAEDIASLRGFGAYRHATFAVDLAAGGHAHASTALADCPAEHLLDRRPNTYWAAEDSARAAEITVDLPREVTFSVMRIREAIRFGQRIDAVAVDCFQDGDWRPLAAATSIGPRRLIRLEQPATASRLRLRVTQASASPALTEFALFREPGR